MPVILYCAAPLVIDTDVPFVSIVTTSDGSLRTMSQSIFALITIEPGSVTVAISVVVIPNSKS